MKWQGRRQSQHIDDRRGRASGARLGLGGGIGGLVLLLLFSFVTDQNPLDLISSLDQPGASLDGGPPAGPPADDETSQFLRVVLADTEDTWGPLFQTQGDRYTPPVLVLFSDATQSACGLGESAMGPFYCPGDRKVYLDTSFFQDLDRRFGAPGDFAQAYVVAHEVGHHVQTLTGVSERVSSARRRASEVEANALSVRQELQADCYAGVWGYFAARRGLVEAGDVEEGLRAAAAIGDDRLQRQSQGRVVPESFTHGSSAQRVEWFRRGLENGRMDVCDTFAR
jgi:predicted metalloprotease